MTTSRAASAAALTASASNSRIRPSASASGQIALAGFQSDGGGHDAGDVIDVAAHDDDGADLGNGPPETGHHGDQQAQAALPQQRRDGARRADAERPQLFAVLVVQVADRLLRQGGDDGRHQQPLGRSSWPSG